MAFDVDPNLVDALEDLAWAVVEAAPDGMIVTDTRGVIVLANRQACQLFGFTPGAGSMVGRTVDELLPASLRGVHRSQRERYGRNPHRREMGSGLELLGRRSDGTEVPVEVSLSPIALGDRDFVIAAVRDVTRKRAVDASLSAARAKVAMLDDRERIARDLHDSVIQRLYGAGLSLQVALDGDLDRGRPAIERAVDEIDDTITELRGVIHDLHRDDERGMRLADRLQKVVDAQATALGLSVTLHAVGRAEVHVDPVVADAVVAVVRECIANAHRHGRASSVVVDLETGIDGPLRVVVSDDGRGFELDQVQRGHGLDNLVARAASFGGSCQIASRPEKGTEVIWQVPAQALGEPGAPMDGSPPDTLGTDKGS